MLTRTPGPGICTGCKPGFTLPARIGGATAAGRGRGVPGPIGFGVDDTPDGRTELGKDDDVAEVGTGACIGVEAAGEEC